MTQYLLAVHHAGVFPDLPVEVIPFGERDMDELLAAYQAR